MIQTEIGTRALLALADEWDDASRLPINTTAQANARIGCAFELRRAIGMPIEEARAISDAVRSGRAGQETR